MNKRFGHLTRRSMLASSIAALAVGATAGNALAATEFVGRLDDRVIIPVAVALPQVVVPSEDPAVMPKWVKIRPDAAANWVIQKDTEDGMRFTMTPRKTDSLRGKRRNVLILFFKSSSGYDAALPKMLDVLNSKKVNVSVTLLNFQGKPDLGQQAMEWAKSRDFDIVMPMGSEATEFVHERYREGTIPVVSVLAKDPLLMGQVRELSRGSGTNMAYVSISVPIDVQLAYLKRLRPNIKNVSTMFAVSNKSSIETQVRPLKEIAIPQGVNFVDVIVEDDKKAVEELRVKVPIAVAQMRETDPDLRNSVFWVTGSTSVFDNIGTIVEFSDKIPVLSVYPDVVKEGDASALLSVGVTFENSAYLSVVYALDILSGKSKPGEMKVGFVSPPDISINFKKARQIDLKVPFSFFEAASYIYDYQGRLVRKDGQIVAAV